VADVDDEYPEGDRGGNEEWVPNSSGVGNLHQIWDSVVYSLTGYESLPLTDEHWDEYTVGQAELATDYPIASGTLYAGNFQQWATESLQAAQTYVYADFTEHVMPSDDYISSRLAVAQDRLSYGGSRLAALVADIYGYSINPEEEPEEEVEEKPEEQPEEELEEQPEEKPEEQPEEQPEETPVEEPEEEYSVMTADAAETFDTTIVIATE